MNLDKAIVYDIETFPNVFTFDMEFLHSHERSTWEISSYRDDRRPLIQFFNWCRSEGIPMISFNGIHFDYPVIHELFMNPMLTVDQIYMKAMSIIRSNDRWGHLVRANERFAPQIDLFKIHHFDNRAKTTSLKALQINMRSENVVDMPVEVGTILSEIDVNTKVVPYNAHDTQETKKFAFLSMKAIEFRANLIDEFGIDVMNYNDTKIGSKMLEKRLGDDVCYDYSTGRRMKRQSPRSQISLNEIIFPYIYFQNPEFQRVLNYFKSISLTSNDLTDPDAPVVTKGVFSDLTAHVGGLNFHFGTGGMHASVSKQKIVSNDEWLIRDIDVASLYPSIAIVNQLRPEHLGENFVKEYAELIVERRKHKKGTVRNAALKLAANGTYGNSNNKFSVFYDPKFTMTITINGQLMLCMLAEWLLTVPTLKLIQVNTDGITYYINRQYDQQAKDICEQWEKYTMLELEDVYYSRMWIRDVNAYIAESVNGKLKLKGAYWVPGMTSYEDDISTASPPAWHKDLSATIVQHAVKAYMVDGVPIEQFVRAHTNPYDFVLRAKVDRKSKLMLGSEQIQSTSRYYVAKNGHELKKMSPPAKGYKVGDYKRKNKLSDHFYNEVLAQIKPGTWDERIHTKNKSKYKIRVTAFQAGWMVQECNDIKDFDFNNLNHDWYIAEAKKLIID